MTLGPIVSHALIYGVILSAVMFTLALGVAKINPEIMLKNYPPDIKKKHGPMSGRSKRQRAPVALALGAVLLGIVAMSFQKLRIDAGTDLEFPAAWVHLLVLFSVFNLLDWLVLDWLIVVAICPRFIVLPGTEGMAGYKDYWFHFRGFLIGVLITLAIATVMAGIAAAVF